MTDTSKKTIVVFSGDMDKVLAAFVMANGAAAMGDDVTMFFTFWGLNALRRPEHVATSGKSGIQKMFGRLMPRGPAKLPLSQMNFAGVGPRLMKRVMRDRNIMSLEELIASAREQEVTMLACTMSMEVMGLTPDELIDGLDYVGVASYLAEAEKASLNLFI
ncbi:MAG: DsrE/DsrF/DrsH-like family protein [Acidimicrobiales bacterium]